ncbi:MAG: family 43 glycosylhydrolase [Clostridia bacterium]|nr:family 43 glycosylhydrolase [Clostridia bacterium]
MKRILALILVLIMAVPFFASCKKSTPPSPPSSSQPATSSNSSQAPSATSKPSSSSAQAPSSSSVKPSSSSTKPSSSSTTPSSATSSASSSTTTNSSSVTMGGGSQTTTTGFNYEDYREVDSEYNRNLFYYNELKFEVADPTVIYISDKNSTEYGYFYAYGTSDQIGCTGFQAWRSKDMVNWEDMGAVYLPDFNNNWAYTNYWAPEIIYDETGMVIQGETYNYFMFYNAERYDENEDFVGANRTTYQYLSVLYAKEPNGPFIHPDGFKNSNGQDLSVTKPVFDFSFSNNLVNADFQCLNTIDASPFVDDNGIKYMYYSGWGSNREGSEEQCIYGVKMLDWFTPDYSTVNLLTQNKRMTVDGPVVEHEGSAKAWGVNEGPFMIKRNGTYMLTFSVYHYEDVNYQIRLATSTNPLDSFVKVDPYNGGSVIRTTFEWDGVITTAGHHSFIEVGDEVYIAYHTFKNRMTIQNGRALAIDKVQFVNHNGKEIMYTNGPTYGYQPLPTEVSGYENVANVNNVSATRVRSDSPALSYLTDGLVMYHNPVDIGEITQDVYFNGSTTSAGVAPSITIDFGNEYKNVRAIMLHFTREYSRRLLDGAITKTTITYKSTSGDKQVIVDDWKFDYSKYNYDMGGVVYPGGAAILEFAELPVKKIEIEIAGNYNESTQKYQTFKISEVMVLANKNNTTITPVSDEKLATPYTYVNADVPEAIKRNVGATFGTATAGETTFYTNYGYDLTNDTTTTKSVKTMAPRDQFAYLNGVGGDLVYLEAYFNVYAPAAYLADGYPKLGLIAKNDQACTFFYIDAYNNYTNKAVGYTQSKIGGGDWDWGSTEITANAPLISYKGAGNYTKLAMARVDNYFYFMVNDVLFFETPEQRGMQDDVEAVYGLLCFNTGMEVKDYSYMTDRQEILAKIEEIRENTPVKKNGATFGSIEGNDLVQSSVTWNVNNDHYEDNIHYADRKVTLSTTDGDHNYLYFINESSTTLYAEATFTVTGSYNDMWPKFGFLFQNAEGNGILFYADCAVGQEIMATPEQMTGTNFGWISKNEWNYPWGSEVKSPDGKFNPQATSTTLAIYRQGNIFKFLADGEVIFNTTYSLSGAIYPAIVSFNVGLEVTNYRITSDANDEKIKELHVTTSDSDGSVSNLVFGDASESAKQVGTWVLGPGSGISSGAGDAYTWATSVGGENFYFQADVKAGDPINNDPAPKVGLVIRSATHELFFAIDAINGNTDKGEPAYGANNWVSYSVRSLTGGFAWDNAFVCVPGMLYTNGNAAKMGVWFNKGQIYLSINGLVVFQTSGITGLSEEDITVNVGVMGWGMAFSFENALAKADANSLKALASDLAITDGDITVDGSIADWTGSKANYYESRSTNGSGKGFKVMAFMGTKGIYVAYEGVSTSVVTDNTLEWWQNLNVEMNFITSTGNTVVHVSTNGKLDEIAVNCWLFSFKTFNVNSTTVTSTVEMFVPYSAIGYSGTEEYAVGFFAFDPGYEVLQGINQEIDGETGEPYRADSDWWFGHTHPHNSNYATADTTYKITANGLVGDLVTTSSSSAGDSSEG